ncbi:MAG: tRNA (adenosine(37)-N6)-threonylcarbamoyltransferase complex transferase subunit TsaD [Firmicutes bacterium]|nr:tRNA (adenosine(37)-N6)-threonylcarbamoyltransferase complex transferase subunit TsaD [Bacillota bacterium]
MTLILGLETSCDETSAAVVADGRRVLSSVVSSQVEFHRLYGGVVPEVASRRHLEAFLPAVDQALRRAGVTPRDLDAVAVTTGPGLAGALVVGLAAASALALAWDRPLVPVNHLEAHAYAVFLDPPDTTVASAGPVPGRAPAPSSTPPGRVPVRRRAEPPLVVLIVSGGHTSLARLDAHVRFTPLGETRDDAAGEAFDKVARYLGLGYPGGPAIDRLAARGDPRAVPFPRARLEPGSLDFSFSGLKTAVLYHVQEYRRTGRPLALEDVAASFQAAVVEMLAGRAFEALAATGLDRLAVVGGVAANSGLRRVLAERAAEQGVELHVPPTAFCTDNAAMVAGLAHFLVATGTAAEPPRDGVPLRIRPSAGLGGAPRRRGPRRAARHGGESGSAPPRPPLAPGSQTAVRPDARSRRKDKE